MLAAHDSEKASARTGTRVASGRMPKAISVSNDSIQTVCPRFDACFGRNMRSDQAMLMPEAGMALERDTHSGHGGNRAAQVQNHLLAADVLLHIPKCLILGSHENANLVGK